MKTDEQASVDNSLDDASTRDRVARSILEHGPSTAAALAERLSLTPAAIRRHLAVLLEVGHLTSREQRVYGHRGRGRPAKVFCLTDAGRAEFYQAYDVLAIRALEFLRERGGEQAVVDFADRTMAEIHTEFRSTESTDDSLTRTLATALDQLGYVTSLEPVATGTQLCQYHCPVAHVAREFPELCAAETRVFAELLDSHVQRIATIAHGDGVCTTHIPHPVERKVS
ncbi:MAG: helix-turn-helix transcriptional regulator [Propioniciclava sp.]